MRLKAILCWQNDVRSLKIVGKDFENHFKGQKGFVKVSKIILRLVKVLKTSRVYLAILKAILARFPSL